MHSRGFTLVELLVVMTISAILIAAAVPAFQWTIARNRVADAANVLLSNLELARLEASRRGLAVTVCRSVAPPACSSASTGFDGNDWAAGWIVFAKGGVMAAGEFVPNAVVDSFEAGDQLLRVQQSLGAAAGVRVTLHSNIDGDERVSYPPPGTGGISGSGTFAIDYREPAMPVMAARPLPAVSGAGSCVVVAPPIGTQTSRRPTAAGAC